MFHVDYTVHMLIPSLLHSGDTTQQSRWDRGRVAVARRLVQTSPRWQHIADIIAP